MEKRVETRIGDAICHCCGDGRRTFLQWIEVGVEMQTDDGAIDAWRNEGNPN
jgi:hypothetical protein